MAMTTDRKDLELKLLRTFLAVVRHGGIGRTAVAVAMTQPAVSQQILRLEKIIGRQLLHRTVDGINLTKHGELLVAYATRAIELNEEALARLRADSVSNAVLLPEERFEVFRDGTAITKGEHPMETALASSFRTATGREAPEAQRRRWYDRPLRARRRSSQVQQNHVRNSVPI